MDYENKTINWKPLSDYNGGRVLATNGLDLLIGEINSDGDCISDDDSTVLCGITAFADIDDVISKAKKMTLLEEVKNYLENASPEQLQQEWKEMEQFDNCGPLVKDFLYGTERKNRFIKANEVINKLQGLIDKAKKQGHILVRIEDIEDAFPELKESEDERIRKEIIRVFKGEISFTSEKENEKYIAWLEKQGEQRPKMIQWTGNNLKEVVDFTGKSPKFDEWFKTWEDFENYVHSHNNIFKIFNENGSHYEVPVGAWIVRTPDGYNVPSKGIFKQKPAWSEDDEEELERLLNVLHANLYESFDNWLKSLKDRVHSQDKWMPSDEQIKAIRLARSFVADDFEEHPTLSEILIELEERLKKLKKKQL